MKSELSGDKRSYPGSDRCCGGRDLQGVNVSLSRDSTGKKGTGLVGGQRQMRWQGAGWEPDGNVENWSLSLTLVWELPGKGRGDESENAEILWQFIHGIERQLWQGGWRKANEDKLQKWIKNFVQVKFKVVKPAPEYTDSFPGKCGNRGWHVARYVMWHWHGLLVHEWAEIMQTFWGIYGKF